MTFIFKRETLRIFRYLRKDKTDVMKNKMFLFMLLAILGVCTAQGQTMFDQLMSKSWTGSGTLMGAEAKFEMNWKSVLNGQFIQLDFKNQRGTGDSAIIFTARGMYKLDGTTVKGTWFDVRGISFPLNGTVTSEELVINWGTPETEEGKTVYSLKEGGVVVTDYILRDGNYIPFGNAVYEGVGKE